MEIETYTELETMTMNVLTEITPEVVTIVTSNVLTLTAVIFTVFAVMEILIGILNLSTWLFEMPMPKLFKEPFKKKNTQFNAFGDD